MLSVVSPTVFVEDATATLMARILLRSTAPTTEGSVAVTSDITSLKVRVWDISDVTSPSTTLGQTTLNTSDVFFSTLQGWHVDTVGHNFRYVVAATAFPTGNTPYRAEVLVTLSDGAAGPLLWEGVAQAVSTSSS